MSDRRTLRLYEGPPPLAVDLAEPLPIDRTCSRCALSQRPGARLVCMNAEGEAGGLLIVGEAPTLDDERRARPFTSRAGRLVRELVDKYWKGPVALDFAIKCVVPGGKLKNQKPIDACRGYLARTMEEVRPTRIITFGGPAGVSVLGRNPLPFTNRRGYAYRDVDYQADPVPVFNLLSPAFTFTNRIVKRWLEEDFAWAVTAEPTRPPWGAKVRLVQDASDARAVVAYLRSTGKPVAWDVETAGYRYHPSFRIVSLSLCVRGERDAFQLTSEACEDPAVREVMLEWLCDPQAEKGGAAVKYDMTSIYTAWGRMPRGITFDTRLWRKLLEPEASAKLEHMAELIGMGGMKEENKEQKAEAAGRVKAVLAHEVRYAKQQAKAALHLAAPTKRKVAKPIVPPPPLSSVGVDALLEPIVRDKDSETDGWVHALIPKDVLYRYNARDSVATAVLADKLEADLDAVPEVRRVWDLVVCDANDALAQIEAWGIAVSRDNIMAFDRHLDVEARSAHARLEGYFPGVNWRSPDQIREVLFGKLGLPVVKFTNTDLESTDKEVLEHLKTMHPLCDALITYRRATKLKGTYAAGDDGQSGMLRHVRPDERIHGSILLDGAATGRTCVAVGTPIEVVRDVSKFPKGIPIEDVRAGDLAYSYTAEGKLVLRRVTWAGKTGTRAVVRLHWRGSGHRHTGHVDLTACHRVRLVDGTWRPAGQLRAGDRVTALARGMSGEYARLYPTGAGEVSREHRFIYEQVHGVSPEHVHHKNENKLDQTLTNLEGMTQRAHLAHHAKTCTAATRAKRSKSMRVRVAAGWLPPAAGKKRERNPRWLGLTREQVEAVLVEQAWSVTKAARALGHDFNTFKAHVVRLGFDLADVRKRSMENHRAQRIEGAARARHARAGGNHEVLRVEVLPGTVDVFDLTIEETHCFIAGEVCVHNSMQDPNLQNIPRPGDPMSKMARDCFVAPEGYVLVQADFSQLELRVAAMFSGDPLMIEMFQSGEDFHMLTAQMVSKMMWGVEPSAVTKEQRALVKPIVFGVLYGKGDRTLAKDLKLKKGEEHIATKMREAIMGRFKVLDRWCKERLAETRRSGEAWTWWAGERARRRSLWKIVDQNDKHRSVAEHSAWNTPIQGTAAEYCTASLIQVVRWVIEDALPAKVVVPVHDSVLSEVRKDAVREYAFGVKHIMEGHPMLNDVPLIADVEVGPSWGSLAKYREEDWAA